MFSSSFFYLNSFSHNLLTEFYLNIFDHLLLNITRPGLPIFFSVWQIMDLYSRNLRSLFFLSYNSSGSMLLLRCWVHAVMTYDNSTGKSCCIVCSKYESTAHCPLLLRRANKLTALTAQCPSLTALSMWWNLFQNIRMW